MIALLALQALELNCVPLRAQDGKRAAADGRRQILNVKLAIFLDQSLDEHLEKNLDLIGRDSKYELMRAYVDQINYNFLPLNSSNIARVHFELVGIHSYMDDVKNSHANKWGDSVQVADIAHLLDSFCDHQASLKQQVLAKLDRQWHVSLLLTAKDLYNLEGQEECSSLEAIQSTMGVSVIGGIHWEELSCAIVELGARNQQGVARPTSSLGHSAWVATHELAHTLGIHHDGLPFNGECSPSCQVMSPTSWNYSHAQGADYSCHSWSKCSAEMLDLIHFDKALLFELQFEEDVSTHAGHNLLPGQLFNASRQCEMISKDSRPTSVSHTICNLSLECESPLGFVTQIGPALEGTNCDSNGGECVMGVCQLIGARD